MKNSFIFSKTYLNFKDMLVILAVFIFSNLLVSLILSYSFDNIFQNIDLTSPKAAGIKISVVYLISTGFSAIFALIYRRIRQGGSDKGEKSLFSKSQFSPIGVLWGSILVIAAQIAVDPLLSYFDSSSQGYYDLVLTISSAGVIGIVTTVIFAPLFEEIIFRGVILDGIAKGYGKFWALVISSFVFSLIHLNVSQIIPAFVASFVFGYIYLITNSLLTVVLIHVINNGISQILFGLLPKDEYLQSVRDVFASENIYMIVYGSAILLLMTMVVRLIFIFISDARKRAEILKNNAKSAEEGAVQEEISNPKSETDAKEDAVCANKVDNNEDGNKCSGTISFDDGSC